MANDPPPGVYRALIAYRELKLGEDHIGIRPVSIGDDILCHAAENCVSGGQTAQQQILTASNSTIMGQLKDRSG